MESLYFQMKKEYEYHVNRSKCTYLYRGIFTDYYSQNIIYPDFDKVISCDESAVIVINSLLHDSGFSNFVNFTDKVLKRPRHIVSVWLMGLVFSKIGDMNKGCHPLYGDEDFYLLWLLTAIIHDYGYFLDEVTKNVVSNLVSDCYLFGTKKMQDVFSPIKEEKYKSILSYDIDTISKYYHYSLDYHKKKGDLEKADHGIVGGCKAFDDYYNWWIKRMPRYNESQRNEEIYKMACALVAQHNIYKSSDEETDEEYGKWGLYSILSTSPVSVTKDNKMLSLLCLVDTVDVNKREEVSNNVYKLIAASCDNNEIRIGYDQYINTETSIEKGKKIDIYKATLGLKTWTEYKTTSESGMTIAISL